MILDTPLKISKGVAWYPTGLRIEVARAGGKDRSRVLTVGDMNPQQHIVHVMSRWDCLRLGLLIAWCSVWARSPHERFDVENRATKNEES